MLSATVMVNKEVERMMEMATESYSCHMISLTYYIL